MNSFPIHAAQADECAANAHAFRRSGFARSEDVDAPEVKPLIQYLESCQEEFLAVSPHSAEYLRKWPRDPLHTWSRIWEYPYVYYHLRELLREVARTAPSPAVLDFGSGVTFFPFAIARLGASVLCVDNDPVCERDMRQAAERLNAGTSVSASLNRETTLSMESETVDAVYSVSVLEHLPEPGAVVAEFARVLRPEGALIVTIDVDVSGGDTGLGVPRYSRLMAQIDKYFECVLPVTPAHPLALNNRTGPYARLLPPRGMQAVWWAMKQEVLKPLLGKRPAFLQHLGCEALVLRKRK